jgi:hypothetical protein
LHIKFRSRGITQKKTYNMKRDAKEMEWVVVGLVHLAEDRVKEE